MLSISNLERITRQVNTLLEAFENSLSELQNTQGYRSALAYQRLASALSELSKLQVQAIEAYLKLKEELAKLEAEAQENIIASWDEAYYREESA